jgi:hypothetical protein
MRCQSGERLRYCSQELLGRRIGIDDAVVLVEENRALGQGPKHRFERAGSSASLHQTHSVVLLETGYGDAQLVDLPDR